MNQYHIYDPIGKGKTSTVYKGRRKRTVEYVAVKSVPRDQKHSVMTEVKVMHAVSHPNVMRFHAWYETQNHLWLILEYCVGGDLATLLKSDRALPEAAALRLGRDLVAGLQALHATGLVHNDLRPANILLDEHGHAKLGGFSRAGRMEEVGTVSRQQRLHLAREQACLHYLSPELLQGAPTSIASDLWALGCLLYECAAGSPPFLFTGNTVSALTQQILTAQPPSLPEATPEFAHLISRLLQKNPAERISWADLCAHPFWGASPPQLTLLPDEEAALQASLHQWLELHGMPLSSRAASPPKAHRISATGSSVGGAGGSVSGSSTGLGELGSAPGDPSAPTPAHPRQQHLAAPPAAVAAAARNGASAVAPQFLDFSSVADSPTEAPPKQRQKQAAAQQKGKQPMPAPPGQQQKQKRQQQQQQRQQKGGVGSGGGLQPQPAPLALPQATALVWHPSDSTMKPIVGNRRIERPPDTQHDASLLPFNPLSPQEMMALNPKRRELALAEIASVLGGAAHSHTKLAVMSYLETLCADNAAVHMLLNSRLGEQLVHLLTSAASGSSASHGAGAAAAGVEVQCQAAHLLGLLIRHASVISDSLAAAGILDGLAAGICSASVLLQRRCMATLGELLFYIASQQRTPSAGGVGAAWEVDSLRLTAVLGVLERGQDEIAQHYACKSLENICGLGGTWSQRLATPDMLSSLLLVVQSQAGEGLRATAASALQRLLRCAPHLLSALLEHPSGGLNFLLAGLGDANLRVCQAAATMLCQLLASEPHCKALVAGGETPEEAEEGREGLAELTGALASLMDSQVDILRAKALVAGALLVRGGWLGLAAVAGSRLLQQLDRCSSAGGARAPEARGAAAAGPAAADAQYLAHAAAALRAEARAALTPMLEQLLAAAQPQGRGAAGQRGGGSSEGGLAASGDSGLQLQALQRLLSSASLRSSIVTDELLTSLADMLTWAVGSKASKEGQAEVVMLVLQHIDAVCSHADMLVEHHVSVLGHLLPALSAAVASSKHSADTRFCCLKLMCDVVLSYVAEPRLYWKGPQAGGGADSSASTSAAAAEELGVATAWVDEAVARHTIYLMPGLLQDEDPMPLYALKMLSILLEVNLGWAKDLAALGQVNKGGQWVPLAQRLFEWLEVNHPHNNVHLIRLCRLLVQAGVLPSAQLDGLDVMQRLVDVLHYAHEAGVEPFLEPALDVVAALLRQAEEQGNGALSRSRQLLPALLLLLQLCSHDSKELAALAAGVVEAVVLQHPREAASTLATPACLQALIAGIKLDSAAAVTAPPVPAAEEARLALLTSLQAAVKQEPTAFRESVLALRSTLLTTNRSSTSQKVKQACEAALRVLQQ